jgi:hypothetical protein
MHHNRASLALRSVRRRHLLAGLDGGVPDDLHLFGLHEATLCGDEPQLNGFARLGFDVVCRRSSRCRAEAVAPGIQSAEHEQQLLTGGALVRYAPWPLHLNFWLLGLIVSAVLSIAWFLPRHAQSEQPAPVAPSRLDHASRSARCVRDGHSCGDGRVHAGAVVLAMGAQIAHQLVGSDNALVIGAMLSVSALVIGVVRCS